MIYDDTTKKKGGKRCKPPSSMLMSIDTCWQTSMTIKIP